MTTAASLADRLQAALLPPEDAPVDGRKSARDRILDAATRRFADVGVDATTMSAIATEAGLSREWLYRHFPNRDAVVAAVLRRELRRFIDGLAIRASRRDDVVDALTEAFVYSVEFLRDQTILRGTVDREALVASVDRGTQVGTVVGAAVRSCAGYLVDLGGFEEARATAIAETLTRLVGSTVFVPAAELDLHEPDVLRDYASRIVPALVRGT